jgi:hypothetical protein
MNLLIKGALLAALLVVWQLLWTNLFLKSKNGLVYLPPRRAVTPFAFALAAGRSVCWWVSAAPTKGSPWSLDHRRTHDGSIITSRPKISAPRTRSSSLVQKRAVSCARRLITPDRHGTIAIAHQGAHGRAAPQGHTSRFRWSDESEGPRSGGAHCRLAVEDRGRSDRGIPLRPSAGKRGLGGAPGTVARSAPLQAGLQTPATGMGHSGWRDRGASATLEPV